jgi:serine/threonine protein kinase/tetratricopeptide (TPR) repeat protein
MTERSIFLAVLEIDPAERGAYLDHACAGDPALRAQVEQLLAAHEASGTFMGQPASERLAATTDYTTSTEGPGMLVGPYKLLEQIGEGGFGVVFMAEQQQPVRRKVALKVLKPGMDTRQVVARFEAERQALAIMDHPNIARVFDGGSTPSGRPYFVMELVKGVPITEFCDQHHLSPRQRLELFVPICQAVQHAHQKGVIHRDLKPSNILVTMHDTTPVPKVIDFGVAKALGQELTDRTLFTGFAQMVGTPLYMSPEQAGQSGLDIDTRSDIYSLGVLLYELLTGTTPFGKERFRKAAYDEIRRIIREEEPPRPSTRLSESKDSLRSISAQRHTEPAKLARLVRGELDWIVMKALDKDRSRRYDSANGFAADIQRYLNDEPVHACPPSPLYRIRKFSRRHKVGLAVAGFILFGIVLLGGLVGWIVRDRESQRERTVAEATIAWDDVERLQREGKWPTALAVARRAEALLTSTGADPDLARRFVELCRDLETAARLEEIRVQGPMEQGGRFDWAWQGPQFAQTFRELEIDVEMFATAEAAQRIRERSISAELAAALDHWASIQWRHDRRGAIRLLAVAHAADPDPLRNRLREAFQHGQTAALKKLAASDEIDHFPPATLVLLANALVHADARDRAVEVMRLAQQQHPDDVWVNTVLGEALSQKPQTREEAIGFYRAALARRPHSFAIHFALGHALHKQGKPHEAAAVLRRAARLKPDSPRVYLLLGEIMEGAGKLPEALAEYRRVVQFRAQLDPTALSADWFRQIERLVKADDRLPAVLRGEVRPRDAAELVEFALACRFRELEAASARLYGEAFALQPDQARDHRYFAAWAAVLAGTGKGKDAGGLDERQRARLRAQARVWLRDEVDAWRQRLQKEPARSHSDVLQRINCWLRDTDLGCVRDPAPLGRLPEAEREEWDKLWRDLRELLVSAQNRK